MKNVTKWCTSKAKKGELSVQPAFKARQESSIQSMKKTERPPSLINESKLTVFLHGIPRPVRWLSTFGIGVGVFFIWFFSLQFPLENRINTIQKQLLTDEQQVAIFAQKLTKMNQLKKENEVLKRGVMEGLAGSLALPTQGPVTSQILEIAKMVGLQCSSIKPGLKKQTELYEKEQFDVVVNGSFPKIKVFLQRLLPLKVIASFKKCEIIRTSRRSKSYGGQEPDTGRPDNTVELLLCVRTLRLHD